MSPSRYSTNQLITTFTCTLGATSSSIGTRSLASSRSVSHSNLPPTVIHRICADRVLARGANRQTLQDNEQEKAQESI